MLFRSFLGVVVWRERFPLLVGTLQQVTPFVKWLSAFLLWKALVAFSSGKTRSFIDASGNVAIISAFLLGIGKNQQKLANLTGGIKSLLN